MKVYLDHDILSALAKGDMPTATLNALIQLLQFSKAHKIGLFISDVHRKEIEGYGGSLPADRNRWNLEVVYLLAENVQFIEAQRLLGINVYWDRYTCINSPMIEDHPTWTKAISGKDSTSSITSPLTGEGEGGGEREAQGTDRRP